MLMNAMCESLGHENLYPCKNNGVFLKFLENYIFIFLKRKFRINTLFKPVDIEICRVLLTFVIGFLRTSREIGLFTKKAVVVHS